MQGKNYGFPHISVAAVIPVWCFDDVWRAVPRPPTQIRDASPREDQLEKRLRGNTEW